METFILMEYTGILFEFNIHVLFVYPKIKGEMLVFS